MTTARAIVFSAVLISITIMGATWFTTNRINAGNRYQIVNTGSGSTVRLDRQTGDLLRCQRAVCASVVKDGKIMAVKDEWSDFRDVTDEAVPPLPPGAKLDISPPPPGYTIDQ
ncbi:MAG: hypothetical protein M0R03_14350 [Novosphingobium sp.]|nr:hypothetical protein [Novosphingobium sp.]